MKKKRLKVLALCLISALGIGYVTVLACAGGDWDGSEGSMFSPAIIEQPEYEPFFRSLATPFYDGYDDKKEVLFKKENQKDWATYFSGAVSEEALNYWLYQASLNQVDSMIFALKGKAANLSPASTSYHLNTVQPTGKATAFLYFVGFAKRNEVFAARQEDPWNTAPRKAPVVNIDQQIAGGLGFLGKAGDAFLKERYAFQIQRLYFFAGQYDKAIAFYDQNQSLYKSGNNLKWRALAYKAGAAYRQKNYALANYLFAQVYDHCEPLKRTAYLSFHPQQEADWNGSLALAKTTREKEVLWQLFGLYADETKAMKEILKLNPKSELAELLLVRAVNKEEEKFSQDVLSGGSTSLSSGTMDEGLLTFLNTASESAGIHNPAAWHLAAAYLNYIKKNFALADQQLAKAATVSKNNGLADAQYHLISVLGKLLRVNTLDAQAEKELVTDLNSLFSTSKNLPDFRAYAAQSWVRRKLSALAAANGELQKAELIDPDFANHAFDRSSDIEKMISYYQKTAPSGFEKIFLQASSLSVNDYLELQAIRYAQQDKLEEALATFKKINGYDKTLYGNPFTIHIKDCHDCDHEAAQKTKYTGITFIEKMIGMKNIAKTKPVEAAQNYFLVANGFYNMTYFGNARHFYDNRVRVSAFYYGDPSLPEHVTDLALKYYLLARENSSDKEFKAKCTFMAAKCEQNEFFMSKPQDYAGDFKAGDYFAQLKGQYASTRYYADVIRECGYFKTYLQK